MPRDLASKVDGAVKGIHDVRASQAATIDRNDVEAGRRLRQTGGGHETQCQPRQAQLLAGVDGFQTSGHAGPSPRLDLDEHQGVTVACDYVQFAERSSDVAAEDLIATAAQVLGRSLLPVAAKYVAHVIALPVRRTRGDIFSPLPDHAPEPEP